MKRIPVCRSFVVLIGAALLAPAGPATAQSVVSLDAPQARLDEAFGLVQRVRELPDGRVLLADPLGKVLVLVDLDAGTVDTVGQEGAGPDEYRQPDAVYALPGDSTLLLDLGNGRLTVLDPDLGFGTTHPLASGTPGPGGDFSVRLPQGVDAEGRVYFRSMGGIGPGGPPTHASLMRWDRSSDQVDSVSALLREKMSVTRSGGPDNQSVSMGPIPLSPRDGWAVAWDGRVAIARAEPYHLEWIWPDGRVVSGPAVDYDPVRIGGSEKEEWVNNRESRGGGVAVSVAMNNGQVQTSFARGGGAGNPDVDQYQWPDVKPAFDAADVLVSATGEAWVRRHRESGATPRYDVFGGDGALKYQVELSEGRRVIGFGSRSVYVTRIDEFGLQYLERYERPGD